LEVGMMLENLEVGMMDDVCAESVVGEVGPGGAAAAPEVNGAQPPAAPSPVAYDPLALTPEEAASYAASNQPGWTPPPPKPRSKALTESLRHVSVAVDLMMKRGLRRGSSSEVGVELVRVGWMREGDVCNGIGDKLGKGGLKLKQIGTGSGAYYQFPATDILTHLRSLGYDV
jgi:hypothetical protein